MRRGAVVVVLLLSVMSACGDSGAESGGSTAPALTPVVPGAGIYRGDVDSQQGVTSRVVIEVAEGGGMIIDLTLIYDLTDFACKGRTHNADLTYSGPLNPQIPVIDGTFVDDGSLQWEGVFVSESRLEGTIGGELMVGTPPVMCEIEPWTFSAELDVDSGAASAGSERVGGTRYVGFFESGPGHGPGEITLVLDGTGQAISEIVYSAGLDEFVCPNGRTLSGGGWAVGGTLPIVDDTFDLSIGLAGVFVSATEVQGTYDMEYDYGCDQVLTWTATSQGTASSATTQALGVETTLPPATTLPPETTAFMSGTWQGTIGSLDSGFSDDLTLVLQEDCSVGGICGTFHTAGGDCRGDLQLLDATHPTYVFREVLRSGGQYCVDGGMETLTLEDSDTLTYHFEYQSEGGPIESVGTLTRAD